MMVDSIGRIKLLAISSSMNLSYQLYPAAVILHLAHMYHEEAIYTG
jgi:hypothetical protein